MMKLKEYEKGALKYYTSNDEKKRIVTAQGFEHEAIAKGMVEHLGNPYRTMYHWINIEVQELHAL
jgi:hypothetical protein